MNNGKSMWGVSESEETEVVEEAVEEVVEEADDEDSE